MQAMCKSLGNWMMLVAVAGTMLLGSGAHYAMAAGLPICSVNAPADCPNGQANNDCTPDRVTGFVYTCAPEMSDYLAMAFIVMASSMVFMRRRQALARA